MRYLYKKLPTLPAPSLQDSILKCQLRETWLFRSHQDTFFWTNYIFTGSDKNVQRGLLYSSPNFSISLNEFSVGQNISHQVCLCEEMGNRVTRCPGSLRTEGPPGTWNFSSKTRTVPGKLRWVGHPKDFHITWLRKQYFGKIYSQNISAPFYLF